MTAFRVLLRTLSQAGQIKVGRSEDEGAGFEDLKLMVMRVLRERECLFVGEEAGQSGFSFGVVDVE